MGASFTKKGSTLVVKINGDIDHHNAQELRNDIEAELFKSKCKNILFDFKGVSFMDSSGIGMVIGRYKQALNLGGKVGIFNMSSQVENIFRLSGLFKIISAFDSVGDGLKSFEEGGVLK